MTTKDTGTPPRTGSKPGRVFELFTRPRHPQATQPATGDKPLAQLEQNWWALAQRGTLPRRRDVSARVIGDALPYAFIAERIAPGHARLRVAGRRLSDLVGTEARGMPMSCLIDPSARGDFAKRLETVFATNSIVAFPLYAPRSIGRPELRAKLLILPLLSDHDRTDRALGALWFDGEIGHRPRRLQIEANANWRRDLFVATPPPASPTRPNLRLIVNNS